VTEEERDAAQRRLRLALELFAAGEDVKRAQLRRQHPEASDEEVERLLVAWLRDKPLTHPGRRLPLNIFTRPEDP